MNYHPALAKDKEIIVGRKAIAKLKHKPIKYKEPSTLCRQGHHSYPVEADIHPVNDNTLKLVRKK